MFDKTYKLQTILWISLVFVCSNILFFLFCLANCSYVIYSQLFRQYFTRCTAVLKMRYRLYAFGGIVAMTHKNAAFSLFTPHSVLCHLLGKSAETRCVSLESQTRTAFGGVNLNSVRGQAYRSLHASYWRMLSHQKMQTFVKFVSHTVLANITQKELSSGYHDMIRGKLRLQVCIGNQIFH